MPTCPKCRSSVEKHATLQKIDKVSKDCGIWGFDDLCDWITSPILKKQIKTAVECHIHRCTFTPFECNSTHSLKPWAQMYLELLQKYSNLTVRMFDPFCVQFYLLLEAMYICDEVDYFYLYDYDQDATSCRKDIERFLRNSGVLPSITPQDLEQLSISEPDCPPGSQSKPKLHIPIPPVPDCPQIKVFIDYVMPRTDIASPFCTSPPDRAFLWDQSPPQSERKVQTYSSPPALKRSASSAFKRPASSPDSHFHRPYKRMYVPTRSVYH